GLDSGVRRNDEERRISLLTYFSLSPCLWRGGAERVVIFLSSFYGPVIPSTTSPITRSSATSPAAGNPGISSAARVANHSSQSAQPIATSHTVWSTQSGRPSTTGTSAPSIT